MATTAVPSTSTANMPTSNVEEKDELKNENKEKDDVKKPNEKLDGDAADGDKDKKDDQMFECNICLDTAKDAVVSLCGHLFW